jgi:Spy/CpxP family protein refolding chaperone
MEVFNMKHLKRNSIIAITLVALLGLVTYANAGPGWGRGMHRGWGGPGDCPGYGYGSGAGYGSGYGPGYGARSELTEEQLQKLETEREAFRKETEPLRSELYAKELELRSELVKENTDVNKAAGLQKDISNLEAQLDQKRIAHMIRVKEINPDAGAEFRGGKGRGKRYGKGYGQGYGGGRGGMMGYGPGAGGGYCWR